MSYHDILDNSIVSYLEIMDYLYDFLRLLSVRLEKQNFTILISKKKSTTEMYLNRFFFHEEFNTIKLNLCISNVRIIKMIHSSRVLLHSIYYTTAYEE